MSPDGWFRRKSKASTAAREHLDSLPDGLWTKCTKCGEILFSKELEKNLKVCNKCGCHFKLKVLERLEITVDPDTFREMDSDLVSVDPFHFPKYRDKIEKDMLSTGLTDGMITGMAEINAIKVVIGVADFSFIGGSMGSVYGEKVARAFEMGIKENCPVIMINSSGGARMHEGILSLMQMAKTSAAVARFNQSGLMYLDTYRSNHCRRTGEFRHACGCNYRGTGRLDRVYRTTCCGSGSGGAYASGIPAHRIPV